MSLDSKQVQDIATLSRLSLDDSECQEIGKDLDNILQLVEQMNSVSTDNITPMAHPMELNARLREDSVTEHDQRDQFQSIAPEVEQGHYLVPKVIE